MGLQRGIGLIAALPLLVGCSEIGFTSANDRTWGGELIEIEPATWLDPDGCEHWVFDTGLEGFMSLKVQEDGSPVCIERLIEEDWIIKDLSFGFVTAGGDLGVDFAFAVDAYFDRDSAVLNPSAYPDLDAFFVFLIAEGVEAIYVEGHTDNLASTSYNVDLSLRRARAVADVASQYGIFAIPGGMGEAKPAANNNTAQGRQRNRRVEIVILGEEGQDG